MARHRACADAVGRGIRLESHRAHSAAQVGGIVGGGDDAAHLLEMVFERAGGSAPAAGSGRAMAVRRQRGDGGGEQLGRGGAGELGRGGRAG